MANKITTAFLFLVIFAALAVAGLFAGAFLFAFTQKVPTDLVSLTMLFEYKQHYGHIPAINKALKVSFAIATLLPLAGTGFIAFMLFAPAARSLFGDADFAQPYDLRKAGLLLKNPAKTKFPPLLLGKIKDQFIYFATETFVILKAATRKGKGVGFVIPNLLWFRDSMVVNDPKVENWDMTAGYRSKYGQKCYLFSPDSNDFRSHGWNPLSYVRRGVQRVGDTQNIAQMLYPVLPKGDPFWPANAQTLFLGLVMYMLDTPSEPCTLPNLVSLTTPKDGSKFHQWIAATVNKRAESEKPLSRETCEALLSFAANSDNTRSGILATLLAPLNICRDPITAATLSKDDFDLRMLRKQRITIYIGILPRNFKRFSRLINLFFSQLINENTDELPQQNPEIKYQCALMLDEFASLGFIDIIKEGVSYLAGYWIRPLLILQNQSQIDEIYGKEGAKTLTTNSAAEIVYTPKNPADAREYSEALGYQTVKSKSRSRSTMGKSSGSESTSDQKRALMLPQELSEMPFEKELLIIENIRPIMVDKILYWKDPFFAGKFGLPTPEVPMLDLSLIESLSKGFKKVSIEEIKAENITTFANEESLLEAALETIDMSLDDLNNMIEGS